MPAVEVEHEWNEAEGYAATDGRDRDRSALSDVPKRSGWAGMYSHHHRQYRSRSGKHSPANLVLLLGSGTSSEHGWIHHHPETATILGYSVPSWQDPVEVPIYRMNAYGTELGWFLQTHDEQLVPCAPPADYSPEQIADALDLFDALRLESRRGADFHRL